MSREQLNSLADAYLKSPTNENFNKLYMEASEEFGSIHRDALFAKGCRDPHSAQESFDNAVLELTRRDDVVDFSRALSSALRKKRLMSCRGSIRRRRRFPGSLDESVADDSGECTLKYDAPETPSAEDIAILDLFAKKEADQRQLIDFLVKDLPQVDHDTTLIVSQFPQYKSITALAKALGLHHEIVKRKLRKLSTRYDANRFGDYRDYLAV